MLQYLLSDDCRPISIITKLSIYYVIQRSIPLSQQVANDILASVEAGDLARSSDGLLPSESDLSQRYGVSRATVREALSRLEQRGVILRRHGVGTFVNAQRPIIESGLERLESLDTLAKRMDMQTQMEALQIQERMATAGEREHLELTKDSTVLMVSRVIKIGSKPVAYLTDIVPTDILTKAELEGNFIGSVLDIFLERGKQALSHSLTEIVLEEASETVSRQLHVHRGETLLKLISQLFSLDGRVVDYSFGYFVPGFFHFHVIRRIDPSDL
jgi:GntR family transcriptional regulator